MNTEFTSCEDCGNDAQACGMCIHQGARTDMFIQKQKIIDLSVCIESGIDMEFSNNIDHVGWRTISKLHAIKCYYIDSIKKYNWGNCRVRENHWIAWQGGVCPLPEGLYIEVIFRNGASTKASGYVGFSWDNTEEDGDIIAFKVIGTAPGWKYEWE